MALRLTSYSEINDLVRGSVDMHMHFGPDPLFPRRIDAVGAARDAQEAGMLAIVLKSHSYPTAPVAYEAQKAAPDVKVIGSICLDQEMGGCNPHAVQASADIDAKVCWLPTFTSKNSLRKAATSLGLKINSEGISVLGDDGKLLPEMRECLRIIKDYDMVVASGHVSPAEIYAVMDECEEIGLEKIVITHALEFNVYDEPLTLDQIIELAKRGAYIEHVALTCLPAQKFTMPPPEMVDAIKRIGPSRCVLGTDCGVSWNPPPAEAMRMFVSILLRHGLPAEDISHMARLNPARLLGLGHNYAADSNKATPNPERNNPRVSGQTN
jgi:predicted TIM-barrel fold metal-dependent hydrolase